MRLNADRQAALEPKRIEHAEKVLNNMGYKMTYKDSTRLEFIYKDETVRFYPYSGWHSGKTIKDGRGLQHLIKQLLK